jgi:hypothetical protein
LCHVLPLTDLQRHNSLAYQSLTLQVFLFRCASHCLALTVCAPLGYPTAD